MITSLILGGSIFILLLVIALYVVYVIGLWKLFKKAGKQGWEAIIPFYNTYVLVEISGLIGGISLLLYLALFLVC